MVRLTWLDAALIAGGVIVTTVAVAAAMAKAKPPEEAPPPEVPPPEIPPVVPAIPAAIEFPTYPTSLSQLYGFYYIMSSPILQKLQYKALTSFKGPPYPEGIVMEYATLRVLDAAGRGVPNVAVLVWSVPTRDDQSGRLSINGAPRSEVEALRMLTNANGEIKLWLQYEILNIKLLEDRHAFGCCVPMIGMTNEIDVGGECGIIYRWMCYKSKDARTDVKAYTVNARIEGTVKTNLFVVSCQAIGKALW